MSIIPANGIRRLFCAAALGLALVGSVATLAAPAGRSPAEVPAPSPPTFSEQVAVSWVLVPVVVRSPHGLETELGKSQFRLLVAGRPVAFQHFDRERKAPWSLVLLQDLSGSMAPGGRLELSRVFARCLVQALGPGDEMALAAFAGEATEVEVPFPGDPSALEETIANWEPWGTTALHDAVSWIPEISLEGRQLRRAAVLVTDGADNASSLAPAEARRLVERAQIPVYAIGLGTGSPYRLNSEGKKLYRYADVLNLLAHSTGGRYFAVTSREQVLEACQQITDELRFQYVLGFATAPGTEEEYRELKVELPGKGAWFVRHRRGYIGGRAVTD